MKTVQLLALVKRNVKLYFKDKGMFFSSLITPLILLILYGTFLRKVYADSFSSALAAFGITVSDTLLDGFVGGQLVSSLLAVSCVTVSFCSNLLMVQDKVSGARHDLTIAPIKPGTLALSYFLSTFCSALLINVIASAACFAFLGVTGWYLSITDVLLVLLDVLLLSLFGTALSSCAVFALKTQGQASAVGTLVSAGYGFVCGAYMPISQFSESVQRVISFLPGTYGTALLRNHALRGVLKEMQAQGFSKDVIKILRDSVDCNLYFFDTAVPQNVMLLILIGTILALVTLYIVLNTLLRKKL